MKSYIAPLVILFVLFQNGIDAQPTSPKPDSLCWMIKLCQNDKFVWAKSNLGLLLINTHNLKTLTFTEKNSVLPSDSLTCGVFTPDGQSYIGTEKGILWWDAYGFMVINTENSKLPSNSILSIKVQANGSTLVTTALGT